MIKKNLKVTFFVEKCITFFLFLFLKFFLFRKKRIHDQSIFLKNPQVLSFAYRYNKIFFKKYETIYKINYILLLNKINKNLISKDLALSLNQDLEFFSLISENNLKSNKIFQLEINSITCAPNNFPRNFNRKTSKTLNILFLVKNGEIKYNTHVFKDNDFITIDRHNDPYNSYTCGFLERIYFHEKSNIVCFKKDSKKNFKIPKGFLLSTKTGKNYFHFLLEDLTKLFTLNSYDLENTIPLLVRDDMPYQHYQALFTCSKEERAIIFFKISDKISVKNLYISQVPGYYSDDIEVLGEERVSISSEHVLFLRKNVLDRFKEQNINFSKTYKRIFLYRKKRSISNFYQLKILLKKYNFKLISCENLSFFHQVCLFRDAEIVVGPAGAAFSNIIFCKQKTKIIVLNSEQHQDNCVFSTLADIVGLNYQMILGKKKLKFNSLKILRQFKVFLWGKMFDYFSSFTLNIKEMDKVLEDACRKQEVL